MITRSIAGDPAVLDVVTDKEHAMTPDEQIKNMTKAINQAIKVMGDRFGSTETDVARAIQDLKTSMQSAPTAPAKTTGASPTDS